MTRRDRREHRLGLIARSGEPFADQLRAAFAAGEDDALRAMLHFFDRYEHGLGVAGFAEDQRVIRRAVTVWFERLSGPG